ncbi:MAG: hypothetical protein JNL05_11115 [Flavobacteriales bacterium]|nr:hypothetical protein [Flavobacteriales bacterium]
MREHRFAARPSFLTAALPLLLAVLHPGITARAQGLPGNGWVHEHFMVRDGLPQNSVRDMLLDSLDHLWFTTQAGLVRYDGVNFRKFDVPEGSTPNSERLRQLIATTRGEVVFDDLYGTLYQVHGHSAVVRLSDQYSSNLMFEGGAPSLDVLLRLIGLPKGDALRRGLVPDNVMRAVPVDDHRWYAVGPSGVVLLHDIAIVDTVSPPLPVRHLFAIAGRLYGRTDQEVLDLGPADGRARTAPFPPRPVRWTGAAPPEGGRLIWRLGDAHALLVHGTSIGLIAPGDGPHTLTFTDMEVPSLGHSLINTAMWCPPYGKLLVGTDVRGLHVLWRRMARLRRGPTMGPGASSSVLAQVPLPHGELIAFTSDGAVHQLDSAGSSRQLPIRTGKAHRAAFLDRSGRLIHTSGDSLMRYDLRTGVHELLAEGERLIWTIKQEGDSIWVGEEFAIGLYTAGAYRKIASLPDGPGPTMPLFLLRRADGARYFGTCAGLYRFDSSGLVELVPGTSMLCVRSHLDLGPYLLLGTYGSGIHVLHPDGRITALPLDRPGILSHTHGFLDDGKGHVWMTTNKGLVRMERARLLAFLKGEVPGIDHTLFRDRVGLESVEFNGGCDPAMVMLPGNVLSMPSIEGIVQLEAARMPASARLDQVLFEDIVVDGRDWPMNEHLVLPTDVHELRLQFSIPCWNDVGDLDLEYMVEGHGKDWRPLDVKAGSLTLQNLRPGEHLLRIRRAGGGPVSINGDTELWFKVDPPWWRTPKGIGMLLATLVLAIWGSIRLYTWRVQARNRELAKAVERRTSELRQANAELEAGLKLKARMMSVITHDIVSPLRFMTRVARLSQRALDKGETRSVGESLRDMSSTSEKLHALVTNLLHWMKHQEGVLATNPATVDLRRCTDEVFSLFQDQAREQGITLVNHIAGGTTTITDRDMVCVVMRNVVLNALKHTQNGSVQASSESRHQELRIIVSDTGSGMGAEEVERIRALRDTRHEGQPLPLDQADGGLGYVIITDLLRLIGGSFELDSKPGKGTTVTIRLPAEGSLTVQSA